uniref:Calreticulin 3b n=1 Tax=Neogobius melanostomus TaxID=47308 RepID=A0A8C6UP69_9GOBI
KMQIFTVVAVVVAVCSVHAKVYFREEFLDGDEWRSRWVDSKHKSDYGEFKLTAGSFYGDAAKDKGLQTSQDARFYATSARFEPFSNEGKSVVFQFTVKHEQKIDCGGGYIKVFPADLDQADMHGESSYYLMFGPDICGYSTKKVHVIFNYKGKNHLIKKEIKCKDDELTHLYTLILNPDQTYEVKIDNEKVESGSLEEDWDFLPPKKIKDPEAKKPEDWDDRAKIDDPEDTKPEDWDKAENIPDPDVKSGTIFDNFAITDDAKEAEEIGNETWGVTKDPELKMKQEQDDVKRKEEEERNKAQESEDADADADADEEEEEEEEEEEDTKDDVEEELSESDEAAKQKDEL